MLVSALVLRSRNLGQCDLVRFSRTRLVEILEVKGRPGRGVSKPQWARLRAAGLFLGLVFKSSVRVKTDADIGQ